MNFYFCLVSHARSVKKRDFTAQRSSSCSVEWRFKSIGNLRKMADTLLNLLSTRNLIDIEQTICPPCASERESAEHLFLHYYESLETFERFYALVGLPVVRVEYYRTAFDTVRCVLVRGKSQT